MISNQQVDCKTAYDAVIIGSGLTGGWAAKELSEAGLQVLVLEAGPARDREVLDGNRWTTERRIAASKRQPVQSQHSSYWVCNPDLFVDDAENPYTNNSKESFLWIRGRQVGGKSLLWGGLTLRFSDYEFRAPEIDGVGSCWPLNYADLAPFYDRVEDFLQIQGSVEGLDQLPDGKFTAAPRLTDAEQRFKRAVEAKWISRRVIIGRGIPHDDCASSLGQKDWPPLANLSNTLACALQTGRTWIRPNSVVSHLLVDKQTAKIKGVACIDRETGAAFEVAGRIIVLCASTIESVRILLNSRCSQFPNGIGNSSGLLGRFLLDHLVVWIAGTLEQDKHEAIHHPLGGAHGILIPKFRNVTEPCPSFCRGYGIWGGMQRTPGQSQDIGSWFLNSLIEVLPRANNRIEIDMSKSDAWGVPVPKIQLEYSDNELRMKTDATRVMLEMCKEANIDVRSRGRTLPGQYVHELGGARMGTASSTSVLTSFNQCWDARNLFVVDGSCFVTSGWQNPSLTMMALAVRACSFIVQELSKQNL
jgi:choline dehydrogenase-like flavoprotein